MKIKYVGVKVDGETAFASASGIALWLAGDSHDVDDAVAAKMIKHPDVFAANDIDEQPQAPAEMAPVSIGSTQGAVDQSASLTPLEGMTKEQLHALAKDKGLKVHHNAGIETLIKAISGDSGKASQ